MPKRINVRVAAGRLIIQRAADDPKRKEGEFRPMDPTDEECKAAWKGALREGAQPPDDGLYVVETRDGISTLCGVTEHRDPETDLTDAETKAADRETDPSMTDDEIRAQEDEDSYAAEDAEPSDDDSDQEAVEQDSQAEMADAAEEKAAREEGAEPDPTDDPREISGP